MMKMRSSERLPLMAATGMLVCVFSACGPASPTEAGRHADPQLFESMYVKVVEWRDTLMSGEVATARMKLFLATGVPYDADYYFFHSPDTHVVGLYPASSPDARQVLAFATGKVSILLVARVRKNPNSDDPEFYEARIERDVVVVPSP